MESIWCRNFNCKYIDIGNIGRDGDGRFSDCKREYIMVNKDGKCESQEEDNNVSL